LDAVVARHGDGAPWEAYSVTGSGTAPMGVQGVRVRSLARATGSPQASRATWRQQPMMRVFSSLRFVIASRVKGTGGYMEESFQAA
jgi:hypothetical protein